MVNGSEREISSTDQTFQTMEVNNGSNPLLNQQSFFV